MATVTMTQAQIDLNRAILNGHAADLKATLDRTRHTRAAELELTARLENIREIASLMPAKAKKKAAKKS